MISVPILTKNEEQDLPGLQSVRWSDDVHVYDSGSSDRTVQLAESFGAHVTVKPPADPSQLFGGNESDHTNWAFRNLPFRYPWLLHMAADERVSVKLAESIGVATSNPGERVGFRVQRRDFWGDRWLKHVVATSHHLRVFRPEKMRYERLINSAPVADGPVGDLSGYLDHYPFSKGVTHWLNRHNAYSSLEAKQIALNRANRTSISLQALFSPDRTRRRFHQKELFNRMPGRPVLKFLLLYFFKGGFLDGHEGLDYARLQMIYEWMIVQKTKEFASPLPPSSFLSTSQKHEDRESAA